MREHFGICVVLILGCLVSVGFAEEVTQKQYRELRRKVDELELKVEKMEEHLNKLGAGQLEQEKGDEVTSETSDKDKRLRPTQSGRKNQGQLNIRKQRINRLAGKWEWKAAGQKVATLNLKKDMTVEWKDKTKTWKLSGQSFEIEFEKGLLKATEALKNDPLTLRAIWEPSDEGESVTGEIIQVE